MRSRFMRALRRVDLPEFQIRQWEFRPHVDIFVKQNDGKNRFLGILWNPDENTVSEFCREYVQALEHFNNAAQIMKDRRDGSQAK